MLSHRHNQIFKKESKAKIKHVSHIHDNRPFDTNVSHTQHSHTHTRPILTYIHTGQDKPSTANIQISRLDITFESQNTRPHFVALLDCALN